MNLEDLYSFEYEDFEMFNLIIGEILLRKVLHKWGYNQRELLLDQALSYYSEGGREEAGLYAARKVFELLGYTLGEPDETRFEQVFEGYRQTFYVDLAVPELNGWSAHRLNPYRERWKECFEEAHYTKPDYEVRLRTIRSRRNVLRLSFDTDASSQFFYELPTLVENFIKWREELLEVIGIEPDKPQVA